MGAGQRRVVSRRGGRCLVQHRGLHRPCPGDSSSWAVSSRRPCKAGCGEPREAATAATAACLTHPRPQAQTRVTSTACLGRCVGSWPRQPPRRGRCPVVLRGIAPGGLGDVPHVVCVQVLTGSLLELARLPFGWMAWPEDVQPRTTRRATFDGCASRSGGVSPGFGADVLVFFFSVLQQFSTHVFAP